MNVAIVIFAGIATVFWILGLYTGCTRFLYFALFVFGISGIMATMLEFGSGRLVNVLGWMYGVISVFTIIGHISIRFKCRSNHVGVIIPASAFLLLVSLFLLLLS